MCVEKVPGVCEMISPSFCCSSSASLSNFSPSFSVTLKLVVAILSSVSEEVSMRRPRCWLMMENIVHCFEKPPPFSPSPCFTVFVNNFVLFCSKLLYLVLIDTESHIQPLPFHLRSWRKFVRFACILQARPEYCPLTRVESTWGSLHHPRILPLYVFLSLLWDQHCLQ